MRDVMTRGARKNVDEQGDQRGKEPLISEIERATYRPSPRPQESTLGQPWKCAVGIG